jgi:signal transduction histidine kinase
MPNQRAFQFELQVKRVDHLYRQSVTAPVATAIVAVSFSVFAWNLAPRTELILWNILVLLSMVSRTIFILQWRRQHDLISKPKQLSHWLNLLTFSLGFTGVIMAWLSWMVTLYLSGPAALLIAVSILAILAASVASYSSSLPACLAILIPVGIVWPAAYLYVGGTENYLGAAMTLLYVLVMIRMAKNWNAYTLQSLDQQFELHEKEERLRHNRDVSGAVDWEWNLLTDAFFCEGRLEHLFGTEGTIFRGDLRHYLEKVHPQDRAGLELAMTGAIQGGNLDAEHRVTWPDGEVHYIAMRGRVQYDEARRPVRMTGICWNITAKKIEEQLRHERDLFEAADRAKLVFLANASHEIRTPLSAINGFAELILQNRDVSPEIIDDANIILRNGKYLAAIVNDLLDLSKAEADHLYIQKSAMSPLREIQDSLLIVQAAAKQKGLSIKTVYESPIPETIHTDSTRFRQILINLLTNAIKYTNKGGITVYISFRATERDSSLRIVVADTGIGISEETKRNLFQPFSRGQSNEVQRVSGSGLGLALSRNLARKMGGDLKLINLDTVSNERTFFEFTVDTGSLEGVRLIRGEDPAPANVESIMKGRLNERLAGKRILLVEDQVDLRELMQRFLEGQGAQLTVCNNGQDAVEAASHAEFDAILMDIQMPILDGYEATRALRQRGYTRPIVALTAHASTIDREKCYTAGCDFYLSKPVNTSHLMDLLTRQIPSSGTSLRSI